MRTGEQRKDSSKRVSWSGRAVPGQTAGKKAVVGSSSRQGAQSTTDTKRRRLNARSIPDHLLFLTVFQRRMYRRQLLGPPYSRGGTKPLVEMPPDYYSTPFRVLEEAYDIRLRDRKISLAESVHLATRADKKRTKGLSYAQIANLLAPKSTLLLLKAMVTKPVHRTNFLEHQQRITDLMNRRQEDGDDHNAVLGAAVDHSHTHARGVVVEDTPADPIVEPLPDPDLDRKERAQTYSRRYTQKRKLVEAAADKKPWERLTQARREAGDTAAQLQRGSGAGNAFARLTVQQPHLPPVFAAPVHNLVSRPLSMPSCYPTFNQHGAITYMRHIPQLQSHAQTLVLPHWPYSATSSSLYHRAAPPPSQSPVQAAAQGRKHHQPNAQHLALNLDLNHPPTHER